jgi:hypothetical protein
MSEHSSDLVDIACTLKHETAKAYLVNDGSKDVWVPKSKCEYVHGVLVLPSWLAKDKGLI